VGTIEKEMNMQNSIIKEQEELASRFLVLSM